MAQKRGETVWGRMSKVNSELFTLTYGAFVTQLIRDFENVELINQQIEKIGYNIGIRLVDEFLAKSGVTSCQNLRDTADAIAKVAFKMFLGVNADVTSWSPENTSFSIVLYDNPLIDFVELPPQYTDLQYSNVLVGVIRGALEMVQLQVDCRFVRDALRGDDLTEIRVELKSILSSQMADDYKEA
mmetsp:Transcript_8011/g.8154  ORF Transcript_8011/g.8154 Transcript_8011/m.8154 type:complete len:185 (-) Transcript_8011:37-591(-)|eukprot:CAMPEP_0182417400 /NCGR_PEP_ID=MMETSP1167-20130531/1864_1 /TAXON_ID=2988 /ORGANISM="Mallomonas Sp, Strain CCMP3275" /LENGTH=184 /DNA_ID=CAMNT_0024590939 /DNA_START=64 /DNA_END=618 /DNA_ORIENTATION=+